MNLSSPLTRPNIGTLVATLLIVAAMLFGGPRAASADANDESEARLYLCAPYLRWCGDERKVRFMATIGLGRTINAICQGAKDDLDQLEFSDPARADSVEQRGEARIRMWDSGLMSDALKDQQADQCVAVYRAWR